MENFVSTNVLKEKREQLVAKIKAIKSYIAAAPQDENTARLLAYIADIEKDIKGKKYGLVFEEHREKIDEILEQNTPVLTEEKDLFIDNGGQMNFLIEGDNLAALQLLEKTHKGKIDLIYIDPPYNTGKQDFLYDDTFVDEDDNYRHSKWCSFIQKRLHLAKCLLKESGFIAISISDNEYQTLKLLCDECFGEKNYLTTFHIQVRYADKSLAEGKIFKPLMEYVVFYAKNNDFFNPKRETEEYGLEKFCYRITEMSEGTRFIVNEEEVFVFKPGEWQIKKENGNINGLKETWITGSIYTNMSYGAVFRAVVEPRIKIDGVGCLYKVMGRGDDGRGYRYYTGPAKSSATKGKMYSGIPLTRVEEIKNGTIPLRYLPILTVFDFAPDFGNINSEGGVHFTNGKKPVKMVKQIINYSLNTSATILDFFAGSGTTGHAVMKLNAEDGGRRKFILCTNNENNICRDVTYERIKRVIERDKYEASLKYFKVDFVSISDKLYYEYADELLKHIRELVELENGINFNGNAEIAIVLTEKELDEFTANMPEKCKAIYLGHDVLPSEAQESMFKSRGIAVNIIPDYYYRELEG